MLKREWGAESNGKPPHLSIPSKTAVWVPEFAVEDLSLCTNAGLGPALPVKYLHLGRTLWWWWYIYLYISLQSLLPNGRSFTANSGTKAAVLLGISRCGSFPLFSLASKQTLKDPMNTNVEVRRVDLANWALRTTPKFITGVKYQFHQSFWADQITGNHNYPYIYLLSCKAGPQVCSSAEGRSSTTNSVTKAAVLPGIE